MIAVSFQAANATDKLLKALHSLREDPGGYEVWSYEVYESEQRRWRLVVSVAHLRHRFEVSTYTLEQLEQHPETAALELRTKRLMSV